MEISHVEITFDGIESLTFLFTLRFLLYHLISSKHASRRNLTIIIALNIIMEQVKCCRCCRMLSNGISHRNWVVYVVRECGVVCVFVMCCNWWSAVRTIKSIGLLGKWAKCESQLKVITLLLVIYKIIFKSLNGDCSQRVCVFFKHFPPSPSSFIHTYTIQCFHSIWPTYGKFNIQHISWRVW